MSRFIRIAVRALADNHVELTLQCMRGLVGV